MWQPLCNKNCLKLTVFSFLWSREREGWKPVEEGRGKVWPKSIKCCLLVVSYISLFLFAADWIQFTSVTQSCLTLCDPMNRSTPGLPVHHQLLEFTQTHAHRVGDAILLSHPLLSPSLALNLSQHQGLFKWVSSSHQVAKVLEFQLQHQSFQWTPRTDLL